MDWTLAIRRNRDQLKAIVLALFALARMRVGESLITLPRSTIAMIMLVLRPAESAVRRLILIAAHGMKLNNPAKPAAPLSPPSAGFPGITGRAGVYRAFALFDPLKKFDPDTIWDAEPVWESGFDLARSPIWQDAGLDPAPFDATHIGQRLNALFRALDNLPAQARRLARWQAKRDAAIKSRKPMRFSPCAPACRPAGASATSMKSIRF